MWWILWKFVIYILYFLNIYSKIIIKASYKIVKIKNKGGYVAKLSLFSYKHDYSVSKIQHVNLLALQQYTLKQPDNATIASIIFAKAVGYSGIFKVDLINQLIEKQVCIDVYSTVFNPKYTRVNCE